MTNGNKQYVVYNLEFSARGGKSNSYAVGFQKYLRAALGGHPDLDSADVEFDTNKAKVSLKVAVGDPRLLEFVSQYVGSYEEKRMREGKLRLVSMGVETPGLDEKVRELTTRVRELEVETTGHEGEVAAYETALEEASGYESEASDLRKRLERYESLFTEDGVPPYSVVEESPELQQTLLDMAVEIFGEKYQDDPEGVRDEIRTDIDCARTKQEILERTLEYLKELYE